MKAGVRTGLRADAQELVEKAAQCGMADAGRLMHMTPREIEREFCALAARRQREAEQMDMLAWMIGRYVLSATHAPRRYPRQPDIVARRPREMAQEDMKRVFAAMAERRDGNGCG